MKAAEWREWFGSRDTWTSMSGVANEIERVVADLAACEAERNRLRETNTRLNRRCQAAEAVSSQNVEACRRAGASLGRSLANWAVANAAQRNEADFLAIAADRDDLRRKLEGMRDVNRDMDELVGKATIWGTEANRKLADASLANAALREAYEKYVIVLGEGIAEFAGLAYAHGCIQSPELVERGNKCREEIAALPVDGLAEEVRKYMGHTPGCLGNIGVTCICGLDALLAKLGARP